MRPWQHVGGLLGPHYLYRRCCHGSSESFNSGIVANLAHDVRATRISRLTGYCRKFIADYGAVARPLMALLKRDAFSWSPDVNRAFQGLKQALLQLLDFDKKFIIECDVSSSEFGVVLHQGDGPITFFNRAVVVHHAKLSTYERQLIGLVKAVRHWRPYAWG
jgi:hypothetical protein